MTMFMSGFWTVCAFGMLRSAGGAVLWYLFVFLLRIFFAQHTLKHSHAHIITMFMSGFWMVCAFGMLRSAGGVVLWYFFFLLRTFSHNT